jgi:hypothetical protein
MKVVVLTETMDFQMGSSTTRVVAVCEDWTAAEQEKARLRGMGSMSKYHLIEKTVTKRKES